MRAPYTILMLLTGILERLSISTNGFGRLFGIVQSCAGTVLQSSRTSASGGWPLEAARDQQRLQKMISPDTPFPCDVTNGRSPRPPTSVHRLRPGDIDVIASMGNSLAAHFGAVATSIPQVLVENRGVSLAGGGQKTWREFLTLPNIIKVFNPKLFGFALGDGYTTHKISQFNVAEGVALSRDVPYMADTLVRRMKNDSRVDLKRHWKVLAEFTGRPLTCELVNDIECSCLFGLRWRHLREEYFSIMSEWQKVEEEFPMIPEFQTEDFAIVTQYFASNISFSTTAYGLTDFTYLSTDRFHLSQKGHARAAKSLWNNLLEPIGKKSTNWDEPLNRFLCPTPGRPYITTLKNNQ